MKHITFATSNAGKVATLQNHLRRAGLQVTITQNELDLIEPQADTSEEIALVKARQAYRQLGGAVLVDDSSFHISALNGFPGPYIKPMLTTIGIEGIMRLMEGRSDRSAGFISSLVFIDDKGNEHVFDDDPYTGTIAAEISPVNAKDSWSDLFKIFIPDGQTKVLGELTVDERHDVQPGRVDAYVKFVEWLKRG
jgi:XTP/dITP diphosphohydrolase